MDVRFVRVDLSERGAGNSSRVTEGVGSGGSGLTPARQLTCLYPFREEIFILSSSVANLPWLDWSVSTFSTPPGRTVTPFVVTGHEHRKNRIMKRNTTSSTSILTALMILAVAFTLAMMPRLSFASGGSGSGGGSVDTIKVSKCYYDAPTGQMLIKASSSDTTAHLYAYLPSGAYLGEVQNGGGSRYGGTVMGYVSADPGSVTINSSAGGTITVPTTPFQI
jgi:hypothetical protein